MRSMAVALLALLPLAAQPLGMLTLSPTAAAAVAGCAAALASAAPMWAE